MFCNSNLPETRDGRLIQANPWGPWAPVATLPMPNAPMGASYTTWRDTSFDVIDTGIGIDASVIDRLFDEFTQADSTISRRYEGTGLGLAISRKLVKTMGGEIGVDSTLGEGSVFHFWLPLQEASGPVIDGNKTAHIAAFKTLRPLRVLIAEDNQINHMIIGALMKKYGHTFVIAENGNEAVIA